MAKNNDISLIEKITRPHHNTMTARSMVKRKDRLNSLGRPSQWWPLTTSFSLAYLICY